MPSGLLPADLDRAERLALLPGHLALAVELEQGEQRHRLGQPVLAAELLVEVDAGAAGEGVAQGAQAPLQRDGRADVADVDRRRHGQQVAERGAEPVGVIGGGRGVDGDAAQARRQRRRRGRGSRAPPRSARPAPRRRRGSGGTRAAAPAAPRPPPPGPAPPARGRRPGSSSRDFSSSSAAIRTRNSVATSSSSSPSRSRCST